MGKKDEYVVKVRKVGNSNCIILHKMLYQFRDLKPGDWVRIEFKGVIR